MILRRKASPFWPRSLCKQAEGAHGDVILLEMSNLYLLTSQEDPPSHSAHVRTGCGKAGKERALSLTQKTNTMAVPSSSRKRSVRQPRVSADSGLLCSSMSAIALPLGFMVILTPCRHPVRMPVQFRTHCYGFPPKLFSPLRSPSAIFKGRGCLLDAVAKETLDTWCWDSVDT